MKDEEMAEEYFESKCLHSYADTEEDLKEDVVAAFLAGLKTGRQPVEEAVEIIRELGGIVREGVTCHRLVDCDLILHRATLFLKEATK